MGVNGNNSNWDDQGNNRPQDNAAAAANVNMSGLLGLLTQTSSTFTGRQIPEMATVQEELIKIFKSRKDDKMNTQKALIVPHVDMIDPNISPILPGLVLWLKFENTIFIAPFLFHSAKMVVDVEEVTMYNNNQSTRVNVPKVPASYIDKRLNNSLVSVFKSNHNESFNIVQVAAGVVNLELFGDLIGGDITKRLVERVVAYIDREWEVGILTEIVKDSSSQPGVKLPSPFHNRKAFGINGTADARIAPINTPLVGDNGVIMPSNMEVAVVTTNLDRYNQSDRNADSTPREVLRVHANVTLLPVSHADYQETIRRSGRNPIGLGGPMNDGWRPFRPCIALNSAQAGAQMNSNGGINPFLMGLYVLMCANNQYAFADVIRRLKCGVRGSLLNLEPRLDRLFHENNVARHIGSTSTKLDKQTESDIDVVTNWIRQHIMQQAIFTVPILRTGANSALSKLFTDLVDPRTASSAMKTLIAAADSMTDSRFSATLAENVKHQKGWNSSMPVFHQSAMLTIDGTARFEGELFNLGELDEMAVYRFAGPNGGAVAERFMRTMYQQQQRETTKSRQQTLRLIMNEHLNLTDIQINDFGCVAIMDPGFMSALGGVFATIGTLNTSSLHGSFENNNAIFAPGTSLAVDYVAGSNGNTGAGWDSYNVL